MMMMMMMRWPHHHHDDCVGIGCICREIGYSFWETPVSRLGRRQTSGKRAVTQAVTREGDRRTQVPGARVEATVTVTIGSALLRTEICMLGAARCHTLALSNLAGEESFFPASARRRAPQLHSSRQERPKLSFIGSRARWCGRKHRKRFQVPIFDASEPLASRSL